MFFVFEFFDFRIKFGIVGRRFYNEVSWLVRVFGRLICDELKKKKSVKVGFEVEISKEVKIVV